MGGGDGHAGYKGGEGMRSNRRRRAMDPWAEKIKPRLLEITGWARNGDVDKTIAKRLGIGYSTLKKYKSIEPELADALREGKEPVDISVENALLKRARGYQYNEITQEIDDTGKLVVTKVIRKEIPPDVAATIIWLSNRKPGVWKSHRSDDTDNSEAAGDKLDALLARVNADMQQDPEPLPEGVAPDPPKEGGAG